MTDTGRTCRATLGGFPVSPFMVISSNFTRTFRGSTADTYLCVGLHQIFFVRVVRDPEAVSCPRRVVRVVSNPEVDSRPVSWRMRKPTSFHDVDHVSVVQQARSVRGDLSLRVSVFFVTQVARLGRPCVHDEQEHASLYSPLRFNTPHGESIVLRMCRSHFGETVLYVPATPGTPSDSRRSSMISCTSQQRVL